MPRGVAALLAALGAAACSVDNPSTFAFQYGVQVFDCGASCAPGDTAIAAAARGDTVWVGHAVELILAVSGNTPVPARLRPDCAENVAVLAAGGATVVSLPVPSGCPDSTYRATFTLDGIAYPSAVVRYTRWIIDSAVAPGTYGVRGRVLVTPRLEPIISFTVN